MPRPSRKNEGFMEFLHRRYPHLVKRARGFALGVALLSFGMGIAATLEAQVLYPYFIWFFATGIPQFMSNPFNGGLVAGIVIGMYVVAFADLWAKRKQRRRR